MFIVTAKVEAWEEDFPGCRVKWIVGQSREVHDSLVDKFRNNPAAWTVSGGSDSSPMQVTKTVTGGSDFLSEVSTLKLPAGVTDLTSGVGGGGGASYNLKARHIEEFGSAVGGFWDGAFAAAMTAAYLCGGIKLMLLNEQTYALSGTFPTIPNNGETAPQTVPVILQGAGCHWSGRGRPKLGSTTLDIRGASAYGKITLTSLGLFGLRDLTLTDTTASGGALVYTTNATLDIQGCAFAGITTGLAATQDAIILGGPNQIEGGGSVTDGFQGYGTVIQQNFFHNIRRVVQCRAFCNSVVIQGNTVWNTCGYAGAAIDIDSGAGPQSNCGNMISGNLIEVSHYWYGISYGHAEQNGGNNSFWDAGQATRAAYKCTTSAQDNRCGAAYISSKSGGGALPIIDDDNAYQASGATPSYISGLSFSVPGNLTSTFTVGRLLRITQTNPAAPGVVFAQITSSVFSTATTITVTIKSGAVSLDSSISSIDLQVTVITKRNYADLTTSQYRNIIPTFQCDDVNYYSNIRYFFVDGVNDAFKIQPKSDTSVGPGVFLSSIYKAQIDGGTALYSFKYDGNIVFGDRANATAPQFNGFTWSTLGAGAELAINTAGNTGGASYLAIRAYGIKGNYYLNNGSKFLLKWSDGYLDVNTPVSPGSYPVAALPTGSPGGYKAGTTCFATNGRKSAEGAGLGTGVPVWWDGATWRTFYDNAQVLA